MRGKGTIVAILILLLIVIGIAYGLTHANISALSEPGSVETSLMTKTRNWLISRAARSVPPSPIQGTADGVAKGKDLYGMECASCHGEDGRHPMPIGQSMYPRVPDLGSPVVQKLSNREIFWVVKNGIRLSGMPGFGRIDTDRDVWHLVYFVRSLGSAPK